VTLSCPYLRKYRHTVLVSGLLLLLRPLGFRLHRGVSCISNAKQVESLLQSMHVFRRQSLQ
jgi:hypothetical protein